MRMTIAALLAVLLCGCAGGSFARAMMPFANPAVTMPYTMQGRPYSYSYGYNQPTYSYSYPSTMHCYAIGNSLNCTTY